MPRAPKAVRANSPKLGSTGPTMGATIVIMLMIASAIVRRLFGYVAIMRLWAIG